MKPLRPMPPHVCSSSVARVHPPNFDDWKWSTDKKCIPNEVTSLKNPYFKASSKFQWFRLAGLEKLSSIQSMQLDENLDKLDSASVLQVQLAAAAAGNGSFLYYVSIFLDFF